MQIPTELFLFYVDDGSWLGWMASWLDDGMTFIMLEILLLHCLDLFFQTKLTIKWNKLFQSSCNLMSTNSPISSNLFLELCHERQDFPCLSHPQKTIILSLFSNCTFLYFCSLNFHFTFYYKIQFKYFIRATESTEENIKSEASHLVTFYTYVYSNSLPWHVQACTNR